MPKRINWKKGMRLTDEVLQASDQCTDEAIAQAVVLAAGGRFGLFPAARPFRLSLSITKAVVNVEALSCLAITRGGLIVDVEFDTKFTSAFDTRIPIPTQTDEKEFLLTISIQPKAWQETVDGYKTANYAFALTGVNSPLADNAMPIARIVYEDGWREDNTSFVPPCLYLSSHPKMEELHEQFVSLLRSIDEKTSAQADGGAHQAICIYWPVVQQMLVTANTEHEAMTPMRLQSCVQQVVAAFTLACQLDDALTLEDAEAFRNYARAPYNYKVAYLRIKQGLGMCYAISEKIDKFSLIQRVEAPVPVVPKPEPPKPDPRRLWDGKRI